MNHDVVVVEQRVGVDPDTAFEVFTAEIDRWWRRGTRFRWLSRGGVLGFTDGRLVERAASDVFDVGEVLEWAPGERLRFTWRAPSFVGDERTEVDIQFLAEGAGTRVRLVHRGWAAIRLDHPARGGTRQTPAFRGLLGLYWADLLGSYRRCLPLMPTPI